MPKAGKKPRARARRAARTARSKSKSFKKKTVPPAGSSRPGIELADPRVKGQLKQYEDAVLLVHQQKYNKARQEFEKVIAGPSKELADRARTHIRVVEQRLARLAEQSPRSPEEHYQQGVTMMNLGRWDEAREHLLRAKKLAPKSDFVYYAMAALDCLTGEAEAAMNNLKLAIELRPENRYHARNDEDFAFLQEDPRFTELLYPEREGSAG
jgi:tetratricopeptide (TPR) repeat protein